MNNVYNENKMFFVQNEGKYATYKTRNSWISDRPFEERLVKIEKAYDYFAKVSIIHSNGKRMYGESINYTSLIEGDDEVKIVKTLEDEQEVALAV